MRRRFCCLVSLIALLGCSDSDEPTAAPAGKVEVLPLAPDDGMPPAFVTFIDDASGLRTEEVHDASREVVRFDAVHGSMVALDSGYAVSGWLATGSDLSWTRSGIEFRVRFGTEQGERRAFFTETLAGTICDLRLSAPEQLGISGTRETPPNP